MAPQWWQVVHYSAPQKIWWHNLHCSAPWGKILFGGSTYIIRHFRNYFSKNYFATLGKIILPVYSQSLNWPELGTGQPQLVSRTNKHLTSPPPVSGQQFSKKMKNYLVVMKRRLYYDRGPLTPVGWFLHRAFKYEPPFQADTKKKSACRPKRSVSIFLVENNPSLNWKRGIRGLTYIRSYWLGVRGDKPKAMWP